MIKDPGAYLKVSTKVYLAFGGIVALCLIALLMVISGLKVIDGQMARIVGMHAPLRAAAYELEINTVGVGMGVMKYLDRPDPAHRQRVEKDKADFDRFKREYDRLAPSDEGRRLGREIGVQHRNFLTLGEDLMARQDALESRLARFSDNVRALHGLLDREFAGGGDARLMQLEAGIARVAQWLGLYLHAGDAAYLGLIERERRELQRQLAALPAANQSLGLSDVKRLLEQGLLQVDAIVRLQQSREQDVLRFIELRRRLDTLLDEGLQQLVERDSLAAERQAESTVHEVIAVFAVVSLLLLAASTLAAWALVRMIILPVRKLAEGVQAVAAGSLDHRIEHDSRDEFGTLTSCFNRMADELRDSRTDLERRVEMRTEELVHLASHDVLTGLANRAGFSQRLDDAIKTVQRRGTKLALLLLDLDGFKNINDSLGHDQGDRLLQEVALRLAGQVREVDTAARLGGDEFCLLLMDVEGLRQAAEVAQRCLDALAAPMALAGATVAVRGSIGIALYPDDAEQAYGLLKATDTAMYAAKHAGKHRYAFYEARMTEEVGRQLAMEATLRLAIERGEFELHYQPQVELNSGRLRGVEALIRWRHPERGLVPPDEFIPLVERIGLIDALGVWVLHTACRQAVAWQRDGLADLEMAVNISPGHFESPGFVDAVAHALRDSGLAPDRLEIEVTESVTRNPRLHATVSAGLRDLGVRVAIDDFGTGYSSLSVLKHMPINTLKLDRQFIHDMLGDTRSSVLIGTIIGMAKGLGYAVVAEGVETLEQVHVLKGLGCPLAQGYFFSRPVIADEIPAMVKRNFLTRLAGGQAAERFIATLQE